MTASIATRFLLSLIVLLAAWGLSALMWVH
jgi:hypothetical protein